MIDIAQEGSPSPLSIKTSNPKFRKVSKSHAAFRVMSPYGSIMDIIHPDDYPSVDGFNVDVQVLHL